MIWDQRPGVALRLGLFQDGGQTIEEGAAVLGVSEDFPSFNPPGHNMLKKAWGV